MTFPIAGSYDVPRSFSLPVTGGDEEGKGRNLEILEKHYPFQCDELSFGYIDMEPHLDADTMYIHHQQVYQRECETLNAFLDDWEKLQSFTLLDLIQKDLQVPTVQEQWIKHSAGGVFSHSAYFAGMGIPGQRLPDGPLGQVIQATYGSLENFMNLFTQACQSVKGGGWFWLVADPEGGVHMVMTKDNQVPRLELVRPLLVNDLWEHSYFLKYGVDVVQYCKNWFQLGDWAGAERRYREYLIHGTELPHQGSSRE